jgi:hypothetical protein
MLRSELQKACLAALLIIASYCLPTFTCLAEEPSLPILTTTPRTIVVFKNGLGFFIREGEAHLSDGWAVTEHVPSSALGSLWLECLDKGATLEEAVSFEEETVRETEVISIQELLKANVGKKAILTHGEKTIEGIIKTVPDDRQPEEENSVGYNLSSSYLPSRHQPQLATLVVIDTDDGIVAINKNSISSVEFSGPSKATFTTIEKTKRIKFRVMTEKDTAKLNLAYLQKGITWIPSYLVNIDDPSKARVTMKATVINDAEDLEKVDIFFVVGYPNFTYADILSPMAHQQSISQFMAALEGGGRRSEDYSRLANIMSQRVTFGAESGEAIPSLDYGYAAITGLPGESEEDLFLYHKKGVVLLKGERAYYHVFSEKVNYEHVYEWEIPDTMNVDPSGYYRSESREEQREQVWHSIKLTNHSAYPWTTAPAFVISGWKPLAQDTIDYTPRGTSTNLRLTVATDIKTDRQEQEAAREREVTLYRRSYDLVTVRGELHINNRKGEGVTVEIKKHLTGEVIEASHSGEIQKTAKGLRGVNPRSTISWRIPLGPEEEVDLTYKYQVYVAH